MALTDPNLSRLIEIFYGLAIAEGLAHAVPGLLAAFSFRALGFTISALLIGVIDWLAYHLFISSAAYKGLTRLLFDLGFPLLVFLLFAAVEFPFIETVLLFAYFSFALIYYQYIARREGIAFSCWVIPVLHLCLLVNVTGLVVEAFPPSRLTHMTVWFPFSTACVAAIFVLSTAQAALRRANPRVMSERREEVPACTVTYGAVGGREANCDGIRCARDFRVLAVVVLFVGAAWLFRRAAQERPERSTD